MLEKNEEIWGKNVRIIGLSVDDDKNKVVELINSKKWNKIEHYKLQGWDHNHEAIKYFKVNGIPHVILVNK